MFNVYIILVRQIQIMYMYQVLNLTYDIHYLKNNY